MLPHAAPDLNPPLIRHLSVAALDIGHAWSGRVALRRTPRSSSRLRIAWRRGHTESGTYRVGVAISGCFRTRGDKLNVRTVDSIGQGRLVAGLQRVATIARSTVLPRADSHVFFFPARPRLHT